MKGLSWELFMYDVYKFGFALLFGIFLLLTAIGVDRIQRRQERIAREARANKKG